MPVECPKCGSRYLRESQPRTIAEKAGKFKFKSPLRCLDCKTRFVAKTLIIQDIFYARCPTCLRMDLNSWSGKSYEPPFWMRLKISMGAKRWRCEYCRTNFVDFRPRKEVFSFKRWEKKGAGKVVAEGRAKFAVDELKAMEKAEVAEQEAMKANREAALALAAEQAEAKAAEEAEERERREAKKQKEKKKISRLEGQLEAPVSRRASLDDRAAALAYTNSLAKQSAAALGQPTNAVARTGDTAETTGSSRFPKYSGAPELVYPKPKPVVVPEDVPSAEVDEDSVHL